MLVEQRGQNRLRIKTPAKVNLFLEVLRKRPDGYHDINSLFQAVSLYDCLDFALTDSPGVSLTILNDNKLGGGPDNLVNEAYRLLQHEFQLSAGLNVTLDKQIPVAAGLGGGSADAAATILACNTLFDLKLSASAMQALAAQVGSDVPFFFTPGQALASGRGEILKATTFPVNYWMLLVTPRLQLSTAEAYAGLSLSLTNPRRPFILGRCETDDEFFRELSLSGNDFETLHLGSYPELRCIKDLLLRCGALLARMSGSGPTIFGIFRDIPGSEVERISIEGDWHICTVKPVLFEKQVIFSRRRHRGNHRDQGDLEG